MSVFFFFRLLCVSTRRSRAEENINKALSNISTETALPAQGFECSGVNAQVLSEMGSLQTFSQSESPVSSLIESLSFPVLSFSLNVYAYVSPVLRATSSESSVCLPFKCSLLQSLWYMKVGTSVMEVAV